MAESSLGKERRPGKHYDRSQVVERLETPLTYVPSPVPVWEWRGRGAGIVAGALEFQASSGLLSHFRSQKYFSLFSYVSISLTLNQNKTKNQKNVIFCRVAEIDQSYLLTKEISNDWL